MKKLVPSDGGNNSVNGLKIQLIVCVIYNNETLEILKVAETYNKADEMATHIYNERKIDALSDGLRFYSEELNAINIIGMKLNEFQFFVDNNPNHPLCRDLNTNTCR